MDLRSNFSINLGGTTMKFLENLTHYTFNKLIKSMKDQGVDGAYIHQAHTGFYTKIPDCIRRCFFLSSTEKEVIYELISWASTSAKFGDGYCKVTESHIRVNTGLSLATVKNTISSLSRKGFISKRKVYDGRNLYRINGAERNPYLILSEYLHQVTQSNTEKIAEDFFEKPEEHKISSHKKLIVESVMQFALKPVHYAPYITQISSAFVHLDEGDGVNTMDRLEGIYNSILKHINRLYNQIVTPKKG
jgi:DNA-binding MarR family transcriptional regulator